jgi:hypothetical protein
LKIRNLRKGVNGVRRRIIHFVSICSVMIVSYSGIIYMASENVQGTDVGGIISVDSTWDLMGSPYIVVSNITVESGVTLTIDPGVLVKFDGYYGISVYGALNAIGSETNRINMTSNKTIPENGDWVGIEVNSVGSAFLKYCNISYVSTFISILDTSSVIIDNAYLTNCSDEGVFLKNSDAQLINSNVSGRVWLDSGSPNIENTTMVKFLARGTFNPYFRGNIVDGGFDIRGSSTTTFSDSVFLGRDIWIEADVTFDNITIDITGEIEPWDAAIQFVNSSIDCNKIRIVWYSSVILLNTSNSAYFEMSMDSIVWIQWYLNVKTIYENGEPASETVVNITDVQGTYVYNGNTSIDGYIKYIPLNQYSIYAPGVWPEETTYYTPHNISAWHPKLGTTNVTPALEMDSNKEITIVLKDIQSPKIKDVNSTLSPQGINKNVNISATISDNWDIPTSSINITKPDGTWINDTMDYVGIAYYYNQIFETFGTYNFTIWSNDTSNNWNLYSGQFMIQDNTLPVIAEVTSLPNPQEMNGFVNISAVIMDSALYSVSLNITDPNNDNIGNFFMIYNSSTNRYSINRTYFTVGTYTFIIWANDTNGNWNSTSGSFAIQDTTPPIITDLYPPNSSTKNDTFRTISVNHNDVSGIDIANIVFKVDNMNVVSSANITFDKITYTLPSALTPGPHNVYLEIRDIYGNLAIKSWTFIINITEPPAQVNRTLICEIKFPSNDEKLFGIIEISGTASYPKGTVQKVEIKINDGEWNSADGTDIWTYVWDTTDVSNGQYTIYVRAYDGMNYSSEKNTNIIVNNPQKKEQEDNLWLNLFWYIIIVTAFLIVIFLLIKFKKKKARQ